MKKLLSLLSVVTISGTAVPTTIAASPYQKEETIKNSDINYQQTNNLENLPILKRVKRDNHNRNAIDIQDNWTHKDFFLHISRENWEKAKLYYKISNNKYEIFKQKFYNMINHFWKDSRMWESGMWTVTKTTFDNFKYINQIYNSLKNGHGLRIKIVDSGKLWDVSSQCTECSASSYEKYKNFNYYNEKIKLLGIGDEYRGEIGLDTLNNKIWFLGNETSFYKYFGNKNYIKITIKDQNYKIIKEIIINGNKSMKKIIEDYNLQNGIDFQDGYIINIWSAEPWRTKYYENNNWKYITENRKTNNLHKNFKIKNNNFIKLNDLYDVITNTQLGLLNDNNDQTIINAVKTQNNLANLTYTIKNKTNDSAEFWINSDNNYYTKWRWKKVTFTIKKVKSDLNDIITKINLYFIDNNNNNEALLNELNYLNPKLNISQLEIINKTKTSAIIKAKNNSNNYTGSRKIYYLIDNDSKNRIIDLDGLIKKGIFLSFRDKNKENIVKEIKNINTDNLMYSNVIASKNIEPIINKNKENICSGKTILENNLSTEQKLRTSSCKYTIQEVKSFQITTGLSKTTGSQTNSEVSSASANASSSTSGSQTGHSKTNSSSKSQEMSYNYGFSLFGFSIGGSDGSSSQTSSASETSSSTMYSSAQEISKSFSNSFSKSILLSNSFDLGNIEEKQSVKFFELELPFQELNVEGNQTIEVSTFLDKVLAQIILNLKQDIFGEINAEIINENNKKTTFKISIREIMQKLQQYNLLPQEITINDNDTITFNGKTNLSYQVSTLGRTLINEIETF